GDAMPGPLLTDLIELTMGIGVALTAFYAAKRSEAYTRKVWLLATIALALYAIGQGLVTYYRHVLHASLFSPWFSAQFLFFWVVPLVFAALIRKDARKGVDWLLTLDFGQVFMVALALHLSVFAMTATWQLHGRELQFLEWRIRMFRDAVVFTALFARIMFSQRKTRDLFARFGIFFLAYSIVSAIYLYAEAQWSYDSGWLDLLWTIPRIIMIWGAVTWIDRPYSAAEVASR